MSFLFLFVLLIVQVHHSVAIRCYQGQSGFGEQQEIVEVDCPDRFSYCLKRTFFASKEMNYRDPTFYTCSSKQECSTDGEYKETFDENKIILNVCCSSDLCNVNSASAVCSVTYLVFMLLMTRV